MFKITADPKFTHPVTVFVPTDGGHDAQTFPVTFRVLGESEMGDTDGTEGQKEFLRKAIAHMSDLVGDDDQPIAYSDAIRDHLIDFAYVRISLIKSYLQAITKFKAGN